MIEISPNVIKQGDTYKSLRVFVPADEVVGANSVDIVLRGLSVGFILATVPIPGRPGVFEHVWAVGETSIVDTYQVEIHANWADGKEYTWPSDGFLSFRITQDLDLDNVPSIILPSELSYPVRSTTQPKVNELLVWNGTEWRPELPGLGDPNIRIDNYTLVLADQAASVEMNATVSKTITVPPNASVAFPLGSVIEICRIGTGPLLISPGVGVTIPNRIQATGVTARSIANRYSSASLRKRATNAWILIGDLA